MTIVPIITPLSQPAEMSPPSTSQIVIPDPKPDDPSPHTNQTAASNDGEVSDSEGDAAFLAPKLRLEVRDLGRDGASEFLSSVNASTLLATAARRVQRQLYRSSPASCPPTRSVTVVLRNMGGVAYTTGTELDPEHHKEIHLSLSYVAGVKPKSRLSAEIEGVLTHEMVHCYQWNGLGTCPGGLVEGIADWVRLRCRLSPPHWRRDTGVKWDSGYQHTAYFLEYLEWKFGEGTVRKINENLKEQKYEEKEFWVGLFGRSVGHLWEDYIDKVKRDDDLLAGKEDTEKETVDHGTQT